MRSPADQAPDGVRLYVRVTPKSSRDAISGLVIRGVETRLIVRVRAAPQDGEANAAVIQVIAKTLGCKPSSVAIAAGHKDRDKTVLISGARLDGVRAWLDGLERHGETD